MITVTRLFADSGGDSHFEELALAGEIVRFGSAQSVSAIVEGIPVESIMFREVLDEGNPASPAIPHRAPHRQIEIILSGTCEIEASDGEIRQFGPGDILLEEDLTGKGHLFRPLSGPRRMVFIRVPLDWQPDEQAAEPR